MKIISFLLKLLIFNSSNNPLDIFIIYPFSSKKRYSLWAVYFFMAAHTPKSDSKLSIFSFIFTGKIKPSLFKAKTDSSPVFIKEIILLSIVDNDILPFLMTFIFPLFKKLLIKELWSAWKKEGIIVLIDFSIMRLDEIPNKSGNVEEALVILKFSEINEA